VGPKAIPCSRAAKTLTLEHAASALARVRVLEKSLVGQFTLRLEGFSRDRETQDASPPSPALVAAYFSLPPPRQSDIRRPYPLLLEAMGPSRTKQKGKPQARVFDDAALSQLTQQIDKTLPSPDLPAKRKRPQGPADSTAPVPPQDRPKRTKRPKRAREAESSHAKPSSKDVLLEEIRALGGDEDDYNLVANLDSDNEEGQAASAPKRPQDVTVDESLQRELAKFASSLGFQNLPKEDDADTDAGEESEVKPQEKEKEKPSRGEKEIALPEKPASKSSGKLVSSRSALAVPVPEITKPC
jgi:hypothetical protein